MSQNATIARRAGQITGLLVLLVLLPSVVHAATATVEVIQSQDHYIPGKTYPIIFKIQIREGYFLHGPKPKKGKMIIPTTLKFQTEPGLSIEALQFPKPKKLRAKYLDEAIEVYSCEVQIRGRVRIQEAVLPGDHKIKGFLRYQACTTDSCLAPENVPFSFSVQVAASGPPTRAINTGLFERGSKSVGGSTSSDIKGIRFHGALWLTLIGIFLGGLALNLTPCIYPLIPITVSFFGARSNQVHGNRLVNAGFYMIGLCVTNSVLGVSAALSGGMLGAVLQNSLVLIIVSGIILTMGLSFFGWWELRLPTAVVNAASRGFGGLFGSFFMGLTLGVVAAPCLGPFILGLLTYVGQKGDPVLGFLYFFVLSIGLGLPLCILAVFSGALDRLPMSGDWLLWVKKCFGWILVGMAVYIIRPLLPGAAPKAMIMAIVLVAAGIHIGWWDKTQADSRRFGTIKKVAGILLIVAALLMGSGIRHVREGISWQPYKEDLLIQTRNEGKPVMIDFYAEWCIPCREMDKSTFKGSSVQELANHLVAIRVDLTRKSPIHEKLVKRFEIRGVPTIVFLTREGEEARDLRIESYVGPDALADKIRRLLKEEPKP